jgi:cation transport regulator ChaC
MWVFGYGSLMWDHWETQFGCLRSLVADLPGYQRVFNKACEKLGHTGGARPHVEYHALGSGLPRDRI